MLEIVGCVGWFGSSGIPELWRQSGHSSRASNSAIEHTLSALGMAFCLSASDLVVVARAENNSFDPSTCQFEGYCVFRGW